MNAGGAKTFDLEERTYRFARDVRAFVKRLPRTICNYVDVKQVVRSSGSVAANYIEANESLGGKDFLYRARVARKEAKETRLWLRLVDSHNQPTLEDERTRLIQEAVELTRILSAIINNRA